MSNADSPRISSGGFWKIGPIAWIVDHLGRRILHIQQFRVISTLGRNVRLFPFYFLYLGYYQILSSIRIRNVELVILRVAHLRDSLYEWNHHVRTSARAGITDQERSALKGDLSHGEWTSAERSLLEAVDAIVLTKLLSDDQWSSLRQHFSPAQIIEILLLVGGYDSLATTIGILQIPTEYDR